MMGFSSCVPDADSLAHRIGVHPVKDESERVRQAFLSKMPAGTPEEEVLALLRGTSHSLNQCGRNGDRTVYRINYGKNFRGGTGYEIDFRFAAGRRMQDVRFARS